MIGDKASSSKGPRPKNKEKPQTNSTQKYFGHIVCRCICYLCEQKFNIKDENNLKRNGRLHTVLVFPKRSFIEYNYNLLTLRLHQLQARPGIHT